MSDFVVEKQVKKQFNFKETVEYELWRDNSIRQKLPNISKERKRQLQKKYEENIQGLKTAQSKSRSRKTIWRNIENKKLSYFGTITLAGQKRNLSEEKIKTSLTKMLRRYKIPHVMIPEYQKDGTIHFHGFFGNIAPDLIRRKTRKTEKLNAWKVVNKFGKKVYELIPVQDNYGDVDFVELDLNDEFEASRMVNYIIKYLEKDNQKIMSSRFKY